MTKSDRRPRLECVKGAAKILTIVVAVITAVSILCTYYRQRYGHSVVEIPASISNDGNGLSANFTATVFDLDEPEMSTGRARRPISPNEAVNQRTSKFRWHPQLGTLESGSRVRPLSVVRAGLTAETYPTDRDGHRYDVTDLPTVGLQYINSLQGHPNTKSDEWADGLHASYDLTNTLDYNDEIKHADSNLINAIEFGQQFSFNNGDDYGPVVSPRSTHYRPAPLRPPAIYPILSTQKTTSISKKENLDWHTIGLLALLKVGLIKLKLFGILKTLFVLMFKLKLFLIAMFFKFHLILRLLKAFKHLLPFLLILQLFPILTTLILPTILSAMFIPTPAAPSSVSNLLSNLIPNLPSLPSMPSQPDQPGLTKSLTGDKFLNFPKNVPAAAGRSETLRHNELSFLNGRYSEITDPTFDIFRKLLDLEK